MSNALRVSCLFVATLGFVSASRANAEGGLPAPVAKSAIAAVPPLLAASTVRAYFDAFRRQDTKQLDQVTAGQAQTTTHTLLGRLRGEAQKHKVGIDLKLMRLLLLPQAQNGGTATVDAKFDVAVMAKKWFLSTLAKTFSGRATFYVGNNLARGDLSEAKIVGIKFNLF